MENIVTSKTIDLMDNISRRSFFGRILYWQNTIFQSDRPSPKYVTHYFENDQLLGKYLESVVRLLRKRSVGQGEYLQNTDPIIFENDTFEGGIRNPLCESDPTLEKLWKRLTFCKIFGTYSSPLR